MALPLPAASHRCPYLPPLVAREEAYVVPDLDAEAFRGLLDRNFRRSGPVVYRPACTGCRRCVQLRVPVAAFRPSRSQRRCWRRNRDLVVRAGRPRATRERLRLYRRYLAHQHAGGEQDGGTEELSEMTTSPVDGVEVTVRDPARRLLAVSILDVAAGALSSVYCYWEPEERWRSLGTFTALWEIELCRRRRLPWYYLGYWVEGARTMDYKARFRPHEILVGGRWIRLDAGTP